MLDNIANLSKILNSFFPSNKGKTSSTNKNKHVSFGDNLSLSSDAIDLVKKQSEALLNNLSSIISGFFTNGNSSQNPTKAFLNQVINPGKMLLENYELSKEQLPSFKNEVKQSQSELPRIFASILLVPITRFFDQKRFEWHSPSSFPKIDRVILPYQTKRNQFNISFQLSYTLKYIS